MLILRAVVGKTTMQVPFFALPGTFSGVQCSVLLSCFCAQGLREGSLQGKGDADNERNSIAPFQLDRHIKVAVKMLSLDPNLAKIHARLISHMPEKTFWYHYFSRVAALREEVNLEPLCEDLSQVSQRNSQVCARDGMIWRIFDFFHFSRPNWAFLCRYSVFLSSTALSRPAEKHSRNSDSIPKRLQVLRMF